MEDFSMMRQLRDKKVMHFILWSLVGLFIGTIFLAWGMEYHGSTQNPNLIAQVGQIPITTNQFNRVYQGMENQLYNEDINPSHLELKTLRKNILNRLIDQAILINTAQQLNLKVSKVDLANNIQQTKIFQNPDGQFSKMRYLQILEQNNLTPAEYESSVRKDLLVQKTEALLLSSLIYSPLDLQTFAHFFNRALKADYIVLKLPNFEKNISISKNKLRVFYAKKRSLIDHPEQAKIRAIFLPINPGATQAEKIAIKKTLLNYRNLIVSRKIGFSKAAKLYSQDVTAKNGGEIGWVSSKSISLPALKKVIFNLKPMEVSEPILTQYGYQLIQVQKFRAAYHSTFHSAYPLILAMYRKQKALQKMEQLSLSIKEKMQSGENPKKVFKQFHLKLKTTAWFKPLHPILGIPNSTQASTRLATLYPNSWKGPIAINNNVYFFIINQVHNYAITAAFIKKNAMKIRQKFKNYESKEWIHTYLKTQRKILKININSLAI
jgi:peptidyl-prolyl cis-trans isomerase D